jgi:O-antigen/teichoic acid export membrane protein
MAAIAKTLIPVYLGDGYEKCIQLIYVLAPILVIISVSNLLGTHYYTPYGKQSTSNKFLICGAVVNLIFNSFLIYLLQSLGAAIASVLAETTVTVLYVIFSQNFLSIKTLLKVAYKYLIASIVMFVPVIIMDFMLPVNIWYLILEVGSGIVIYALMLIILRVDFLREILHSILTKLKIRKKDNGNEQS